MLIADDDADTVRLRHLIVRIACRDRAAFASLYDQTSGRLRDALEWRLGDRARAAGVLVATYVEVWWLAGRHADPGCDAVAWINDVVERRIAEGPPVSQSAATTGGSFAVLRARHAELELADLLGRRVGTLRTATS